MRNQVWILVLLVLVQLYCTYTHAQSIIPITTGGKATFVEMNDTLPVQYFSVTSPKELGDLHFRATPVWGADWVHIYINTLETGLPGPTNSTWFWNMGYNGEIISIANTSTLWSASNQFYVGLYYTGANYKNVTTGVYMSVFHHNSSCYIEHFVPVQGRTHQGHISYYVVNTTLYGNDTEVNTTVTLTKLSGQWNATQLLYSFTNQYPAIGDPSTFVITDYDVGSYFVVVPNTATESYLYIGVYANENSTYTIVPTDFFHVDVNASFVAHLKDGVPQFAVAGRSVAYFHFQPKYLNQTTLISLNTISNNIVDAFITTSDTGYFPMANQSLWNTTFEGSNTIAFIPGDDQNACKNYSCYYILAVALRPGWTEFAEFYVTVTQRERITYLQNGVIATGDVRTVDSQYTYFVVPVDTVGHSIRFNLLNLGETFSFLMAHVSTVNPYVNSSTSQFTIVSSGSQHPGYYRLAPDSEFYCNATEVQTCYYWIALETYDGNCSFEISYNVAEPMSLRAGLDFYDEFSPGTSLGVYRLNVNPGYGHVSFYVNDWIGNSNVYISNSTLIPDPTNSSTYQSVLYYFNGAEKLFRIEEYDNSTACQFVNSSRSSIPHCTYTMLIESVANFTYVQLSASVLNSTSRLVDGIPVSTIGFQGLPDYYYFHNDNSSRAIIFTLQNAQVAYASNTTSRPPGANTQYYFFDEIYLPYTGYWYVAVYPHDGEEYTILARTVTIGDKNDTGTPTPLSAGSPQYDGIGANYTHYYDFVVPYNASILTIEVNTHVGAPSLYCNYGGYNDTIPIPSAGYYMYAGYSFHFNSIYIPSPPAGKYLCAVFANYSNSAEFSIVFNYASNFSSATSLFDGEVVAGVAASGFPRFYQIAMPLNFTGIQNYTGDISPFELRVAITGYSGDPVIFVSRNPFPSNSSFMWRSYDAGTAAIHVSPDDPNWCDHTSGSACIYYIAVYTRAEAYYHIVASVTRFESPIIVHHGLTVNSINSHISTSKFVYNPLNYEIGRSIRFIASPAYGAAYIYVNVVDISQPLNLSHNYFPTHDNYTWASYGDFAGTFIHIHPNDTNYCHTKNTNFTGPGERSSCAYLVSVTPLNPMITYPSNMTLNETLNATIPCQFTMNIESDVFDAAMDTERPPYYDGIYRLIDHIPTWHALYEGAVHYYKFENLNPGQDMFVTYTPIMGVGEMFVSYMPILYPTNTTSVFQSGLNNTHTFSGQSANQTIYGNATIIFVAIRAYSNLTYTITGGQNPQNEVARYPTRLTDGVPQYDSLGDLRPSSWRYYVFYLPVNDTILINIPRRMGDVEVYIKQEPFNVTGGFSEYQAPNSTYYDYAINHHGLDAHQIAFAPAGRYIIGVYSQWLADYAITVTAKYTANILFFDEPVTGELIIPSIVPAGFNMSNETGLYYIIPIAAVSEYRGLHVDVTILSGIATVFISDQPFIDPRNASTYYTSMTHDRLNNLYIPNHLLRQGPYFVLLISDQNTTFSIVATYKEYQQLQMGLPANGFAIANDTHYFHLTLADYPHDVIVIVQPEHGKGHLFANDVTASFNVPNPFDNTSYTHFARDPFNAAQAIMVHHNTCNYTRCTYLIALHALPFSDLRYNIYAIPANTTAFNNATILLQHTVPQLGYTQYTNDSIATVGTSHYEFHVPNNRSRVSLTVSPYGYGGWVNIAIGRTTFPQVIFNGINQTYSFLYADWIQDNESVTISFDYNDPKLIGTDMSGHYFVTVYSLSDNTSDVYSISLVVYDNFTVGTNHSATYLIDGAMQWGHAPNDTDAYHLYELWVPYVNLSNVPEFHSRPVTITLNSPTNHRLQMYVSYNGSVPTPDSHDFHTNGTWDNIIVIPPGRGCNNTVSDCIYLISVYNWNAVSSIYFITAASEMGGLTSLWPGVSQIGWVHDDYPALFVLNKFIHDDAPLKVALSPLTEFSMEALVSRDAFPRLDNYTFRTYNEYGVVTGSAPVAPAGSWVIAVFPPFNMTNFTSVYELTVSSNRVLLTTVPYGEVLARGQQANYVIDLRTNSNATVDLTVLLNPSVDTTAVNIYIAKADINNLPGPNNNLAFSTPDSETPNSLHLTSDTTGFDPRGVYFVLVEGVANVSAYEISASITGQSFVLEDGRDMNAPFPLLPGQSIVYHYLSNPLPDSPFNFTINVEKLYGSLTLCVSKDITHPNNNSVNTTCRDMHSFEPGTFIVIDRHDIQPGFYYISLTAFGDTPASYVIMATMAVPQLNAGVPEIGFCDPEQVPSLYYMNIGAADRVTFEIVPINQNVSILEEEFTLYISNNRSNRFPGANNATWSAQLTVDTVFTISRLDKDLQACVNSPTSTCQLWIVVTGCKRTTGFAIFATLGNSVTTIPSNFFKEGELLPADFDYYAIEITSDDTEAYVDVEQCYGNSFIYYSDTVRFPNATMNDNKSESLTSENYFNLTHSMAMNASRTVYLSVNGQPLHEEGHRQFVEYRLITHTSPHLYHPTLPTVSKLTPAKTTNDKSAAFTFRLASIPDTFNSSYENATLVYRVFADGSGDPNAIHFTACGLEQAQYYNSYTQEDLIKMGDGTSVTLTVDQLDDSKPYIFGIIVQLLPENQFSGIRIYPASPPIIPTPGHDSSAHKGYIIALAVIIPIAVVLLGVAAYFYARNRKLKQELTVELPDVASSRSGQFKKRAVRGSNVGSSSFSRNNENYQTSLLDDTDDPVI